MWEKQTEAVRVCLEIQLLNLCPELPSRFIAGHRN